MSFLIKFLFFTLVCQAASPEKLKLRQPDCRILRELAGGWQTRNGVKRWFETDPINSAPVGKNRLISKMRDDVWVIHTPKDGILLDISTALMNNISPQEGALVLVGHGEYSGKSVESMNSDEVINSLKAQGVQPDQFKYILLINCYGGRRSNEGHNNIADQLATKSNLPVIAADGIISSWPEDQGRLRSLYVTDFGINASETEPWNIYFPKNTTVSDETLQHLRSQRRFLNYRHNQSVGYLKSE